MLILLPPSEGKTRVASGEPVDPEDLTYPSLAESRTRIGDALAKVSGQRNALRVLNVGPSRASEVAHNTTVWSNPADAAARVYSGVLYGAAGTAQWDDATLQRASSRIRTLSALWGVVSPADRIPAYRLSMSTSLARIGPLAAWWRPQLAPLLDAQSDGGLIVDCRSGPYVAAYRPSASRWVTVVVERERDGVRTVVSHSAKYTRGLLVRRIIEHELNPETPEDLADAAAGMIGAALLDVSLAGDRLTLVTGE